MSNLLNVVVLNDTRSENHHGCSRVMNCIDENLKARSRDVFYSSVGEDWQKSERIKRKIIHADIVIVNGEGTIHHNSSNGLALVKVATFAKAYGVKSYLINMTYQANDENYKNYLKDFEGVFVRESYSHAELDSIGIQSTIVPDLTFSFVADETSIKEHNDVLITCSVKKNVTEALENEFSNVENVKFSSIFNQNISLEQPVSIVNRVVNIFRNNNVSQLFEKLNLAISKKLDNTMVIDWQSQFTHTDYSHFLSNASIVVCGRFHAMTICMNHGIPFLAIESNSHKVSGTLTDIGLDKSKFLVSPENITMEQVKAFRMTDEERQLLKKYAQQAKIDIAKMFKQILA